MAPAKAQRQESLKHSRNRKAVALKVRHGKSCRWRHELRSRSHSPRRGVWFSPEDSAPGHILEDESEGGEMRGRKNSWQAFTIVLVRGHGSGTLVRAVDSEWIRQSSGRWNKWDLEMGCMRGSEELDEWRTLLSAWIK